MAGHSDWRAPTLWELQTIIDPSASGCGMGSPCINSAFGPTASSFYWSSATDANSADRAFGVLFNTDGPGVTLLKTGFGYARAVRGGY